MNVKKAIKRIVALGTGAALMGATVLGAMAADLNDFPAPFVENGQFNAMIIVGESAATADVIGAVDIATTLQYEMKQAASVGGDTGSSVTVSGDSMMFSLSNDKLALSTTGDTEYLGEVISLMDDEDLNALAGGEFADEEYDESISFPTNAGGKVQWLDEGGDYYEDEPGFYLAFKDSEEIYTYEVEFATPADSDITGTGNDELDDFEDKTIRFMGMNYNVVDTEISHAASDIKLTLMGGDSNDVIEEYATKTYNVAGKEYEVEATFVGDTTAKLRINGEVTDALEAGETYTLNDGSEVGIREILENEAGEGGQDLVEFYLGANKVILEDTDYTADGTGDQALEVGDETYTNVVVTISGSSTASDFSLDSIKVKVSADDDYFLAAGDMLSEVVDGSNEDFLFGNFDILFEGMNSPSEQKVELKASSETEYTLSFETRGGHDYDLPVFNVTAANLGNIGDADGTLWVDQVGGNSFDIGEDWIAEDDYFLISTDDADPEDREVRFFEFDDLTVDSDTTATLTIKDLASGGGSLEVTLKNDTGNGPDAWAGQDRIDGQTHDFVFNSSSSLLWVDMDGALSGSAEIALKSGAYMILSTTGASEATPVTKINMSVFVPTDLIDDGFVDQELNLEIGAGADVEVDVDVNTTTGDLSAKAVANDDYDHWYTEYGIHVLKDRSGDQNEVTLTVPFSQRVPQVFGVSGDVQSSTVEGTSGSAYSIAPVSTGIAMLDTEVGSSWRNSNAIVVGGPCVNSVAAELMGNPADCTEGFTAGSAMVKLFEQSGSRVAMLVAGYSADDSRRAATAVHKFRSYSGFRGMEVRVSGTSMSDISVTSVQ